MVVLCAFWKDQYGSSKKGHLGSQEGKRQGPDHGARERTGKAGSGTRQVVDSMACVTEGREREGGEPSKGQTGSNHSCMSDLFPLLFVFHTEGVGRIAWVMRLGAGHDIPRASRPRGLRVGV